MNILIIPSWYPWSGHPLRGIFFREQAMLLGRTRPGWNIAVAVWGQRRFMLSLRNPFKSAGVLIDFLRCQAAKKERRLLPNVIEYHRPTIEWTRRLGRGNLKGMVRAGRKILIRARRDFGHLDLIHAHVSFPGGWIAMELGRRFRLPYVITEHMGNFPADEFLNTDGSLREIIAHPLGHARAIVAVSPVLADRLSRSGFPVSCIIPNMVDEDFYKPATRGRAPGPGGRTGPGFIFFSLSSFKPAKGIGDLLQALAGLIDRLSEKEKKRVELRIGGEGDEEKNLRALAAHLEIDPWVRWLGRLNRNQVLEEYQRCDCFVLASHRESFSIVLLEAAACGKPVIATRCGGPEKLVTIENGMLVDPGNPDGLALAMQTMLRQGKKFKAAEIRKQFLQRFSKNKVAGLIEKLYRDATRKKPA